MIKQTLMFTTPVSLSFVINFWGKEKEKKVPTDPLQLEFF